MPNTSTRGRGAGSPARRSLTAAARAAAKRSERGADVVAGRTLRAEEPAPRTKAAEPDWEAPDWEDPDGAAPGSRNPATDADGPRDPADGDSGADGAAGATDDSGAAARETAGSGPSRSRRRVVLSAVLALVAVLGLVAVVVLAQQYRDGRAADRARAQAAEAARKAAPVVLSYDYRRLDRDFAAARAHLTGSFRDEYRRTTTSVVAPTARKYQGVVKATVVKPPGGGDPAVSVVSASPNRAVVLLFVNQVTTSTQVSGPRVDLNRVRMTLTLTSDGWKVSAVDAL
ncbi:hypothetical protein QWM81_21425 [Streptomyces ficellus]|uniref:Mce-associated membrane protein n=1 Tax=Streptomyces ficellus TaxID=1977088 RepID=A0ABT7ZAN0_9ACTN|nr:hypothetical protein [Streptomyces ficellus]MDN3296563.1 hypothetical protein [Streptomyces ficellus]